MNARKDLFDRLLFATVRADTTWTCLAFSLVRATFRKEVYQPQH